jgi:hypothetical protein
MVLPDLNFTPPEEGDVHIPEGEHAGTLSNAKTKLQFTLSLNLMEQADLYCA